ncbi:bifunctional helix-turn-helix transcriptional regulator/GNAT family N-acetyltransferase [Herbaspirillum autotrophicum]|uniref:bifunctional helix-turn-helix transcriptional regulator/GNAT family N-acetyltransferase n=1 Tax=Herbaspirillum autotrophicum TaxID=180195 RepID=UPI00067D8690|nr:helix-turn-helix domain-containing GNAT family N-acetyltransferase [Herbaspirillum autotrophicum]
MFDCDPELVESIRAASRQMVRELGFMQATLAATDYPPSAVHAIMEIGSRQSLTAVQLAEVLCLEKSSVSRMVRKLIEGGELKEAPSATDARAKVLTLTAKGRHTLASINAFGRHQVTTALAQLPQVEQQVVGQGLGAYSRALEAHRLGTPFNPVESVEVRRGYQPGVVGRVTEMHANFYARSVGFGQFFESLVATGMAEFVARLANPKNGIWVATQSGRIVGAVAIDGEDLGNDTAHLRWFIVDDGMRGAGVGHKLLSAALAFCDGQGFAATRLWTFRGLDAARRLYENAGFVLHDERAGQQWGSEVVEQCFERQRPPVQTKISAEKSSAANGAGKSN